MNKKETASVLSILKAAYPNFYRDMGNQDLMNIVNLWTDLFVDYDVGTVGNAVKALIASDTKGFPPVPGQVLEKIRLLTVAPERTEGEAWAIVKAAIRNSAYHSREEFDKLPPELQEVVHSPNQLKNWATSEDFNESVESSNFKRAYRNRMEQRRQYAALPLDVRQFALKSIKNADDIGLLEKGAG